MVPTPDVIVEALTLHDDLFPQGGKPIHSHTHDVADDDARERAIRATESRKARGPSGVEGGSRHNNPFNLHDKSEDKSERATKSRKGGARAKPPRAKGAAAGAKESPLSRVNMKNSKGKTFDDDDDDLVVGDRPKRRLQVSDGLPPPKTKLSAGSVLVHGLKIGPAKKEMTPYEKKLSAIRAAWFINAQWALGAEGTGAPVHYHNTAWNALLYGAKKWMLYKPRDMIMSNRQILAYTETDLGTFATDAGATGIGEKVSDFHSTLLCFHTLSSTLSPII